MCLVDKRRLRSIIIQEQKRGETKTKEVRNVSARLGRSVFNPPSQLFQYSSLVSCHTPPRHTTICGRYEQWSVWLVLLRYCLVIHHPHNTDFISHILKLVLLSGDNEDSFSFVWCHTFRFNFVFGQIDLRRADVNYDTR